LLAAFSIKSAQPRSNSTVPDEAAGALRNRIGIGCVKIAARFKTTRPRRFRGSTDVMALANYRPAARLRTAPFGRSPTEALWCNSSQKSLSGKSECFDIAGRDAAISACGLYVLRLRGEYFGRGLLSEASQGLGDNRRSYQCHAMLFSPMTSSILSARMGLLFLHRPTEPLQPPTGQPCNSVPR
jgi:hypothetical protein